MPEREPACPVVETLNLLIDGTGGVFMPLVKDYTYITRVVLTHVFTVFGNPDCEWFGGEPALTNGFYMVYEGDNLGSEAPIKNNKSIHIFGWDVNLDTQPITGPGGLLAWNADPDRESRFVCRGVWRFSNWMEGGLPMWDKDTSSFGVKINDDMTALVNTIALQMTVLGWSEHR